MPTVVFEINGKMYPLTPSAYTSQVCISREEPGFTQLSSSLLATRQVGDKWRGLDGQNRLYI